MVQISLFDRGTAVKAIVAEAINAKPTFKKDKNKQIVLNTRGEQVVTGHTITLLPANSKTKADLKDLTGYTGQALMLFEQEARQALMESGFAHMAKLIATGNYTFDRSRIGSNGKFSFGIKPANGKAAILSEADLKKQAEALGFTLVAKDGAAPAATEPAVETELTVVAKVPEAAKAATKTAKPAAKKQAANKVATAPVAS